MLTAGVSDKTPDGLLRRVTSVGTKRSGTVVRTVAASITDALLQADINLTDVPLTPATGTAKSGQARTNALISAPTLSSDVAIKFTDGPVSMQGKVATTARATLDVSADVDWNFSWTSAPKPELKYFRWRVNGTLESKVTAEVAGTGKKEFKLPNAIPKVRLGAVTVSAVPPIIITPEAKADLNASTSVSGKYTFGASAVGTIGAGFEWRAGKITNLSDATLSGSADGPVDGKVTASASASASIEPEFSAKIDTLLGPGVSGELGLESNITLPCPGKMTLGPFLKAKVKAKFDFLDKEIASISSTVAELHKDYIDGPAPGCTDEFKVSDEPLPAAEVGHPYQGNLIASGGSSPYTWRSTGSLPDGLSVKDGFLTGTPTRAGDYEIPVVVTDARGISADGVLKLRVDPDSTALTITTDRLSDGFIGIGYQGGANGSGGVRPYRFTATGLPAGLTMNESGVIVGTPTAVGSSPVAVSLTDDTGKTVTRGYTLEVNAELPPPVDGGGEVVTGPPAPSCGTYCTTTWGDPHLRTFEGAAYDFQRVGEFVAAKSTVDSLEIQVRQRPWGNSRVVAVNSAVALRVGEHRVGVYLTVTGVRTLIDGSVVDLGAGPAEIPGGGTVTLDAAIRRVVVSGPDGTYLGVDYDPGSALNLTVGAPEAQRGLLQGLLGMVGEDPLVWRVTPGDSLFDYAAGEDTSTFTDEAFPYADLPLSSVPGQNREAARAACAAAGITDATLLDACTLDVALSGDKNAAAAAIVAQSAGTVADSKVLGASKAGQPWQDAAGATGVSELTFGHLGCTGIDAQNRCTGGTWVVVPDAPWIWTKKASAPGQFRATFTATVNVTAAQAARPARLYAAADDVVTATVNGDQVLQAGYNSPVSAVVQLKEGANVLTFDTLNYGGDDPNGNPAGLAWKLVAGD